MYKQSKIAKWFGLAIVAFSSISAANLKPNGCDGPTLCPSFPIADRCSECDRTWHVDVGLLYQQPGFSNMSPGFGYQPVFQNPTSANQSSSFVDQTSCMLQAAYNYTLGVTASLGHLITHDKWFLGANFDWLGASINRVYEDDNFVYRVPSEFSFQAMVFGELNYPYGAWGKITYKANTDIYMFNVFLSRGSYHSNRFSYEPFAGVEALWFTNNQEGAYQQPDNPVANSVFRLTKKQNNWGVGPMFGMNAEYNIAKGISIFSDSNVGVLYGENNYNVTTYVSAGADIPEDRTVINKGNTNAVVYVPVRTILGVKLSTYCVNETHYIAIKIGYDAGAVLSPSNYYNYQQGWEVPFDQDNAYGFSQLIPVSNNLIKTGLYVDLLWDF